MYCVPIYSVTTMYWYYKLRPFGGQNAIWQKKIFLSKILKRPISLNKYKTIFLYHQFLTSKQPWSSKNAKVIGHTSTKNPLVNKANSYQFINLKFYKILYC